MSPEGDLDRARQLIFAANEQAAKELLLSLLPAIEEADRDDLMMEVLAQLGEIYLVRTAYDGVGEAIRRIDECLAVYRSIRAGTNPEAAAQVTMSGGRGRPHAVPVYAPGAVSPRPGWRPPRTGTTRVPSWRCWCS